MADLSSHPTQHEQAISRIARFIQENPDTSGGVQLVRVLWSLYNMHHMVNLWDVASRLSGEPANLVAQVFAAALDGRLNENDIKRGLLLSGQMQKWDNASTPEEALDQVEQAHQCITAAIRRAPPSYPHTELVRLSRKLEELISEIRTTGKP